VRLDSGGLAKGLAADLVAERLAGHASWAVECLGDVRVGGAEGRPRPVQVADPFGGGAPVATLRVVAGAVATSGTTCRTGHLIDPRTGEPADTGIVQATALAPTGLEAEVRAKTALLAGLGDASRHLPHGGVLVLGSGAVVEVEA
jgi:thiamine biosynthesis lipoprotein